MRWSHILPVDREQFFNNGPDGINPRAVLVRRRPSVT